MARRKTNLNKNHSQQPKIIILKKKKKKKTPKTYAERAEWLRNKAGQSLGFKNKKNFTATQKQKITRLFSGIKKTIKKKRKRAGIPEEIDHTIHVGGLYQWRDAHVITIKTNKQRKALEHQNIKIAGDKAFIPRRQKSESVRINNDGSRTRYIGEFKQKTYPLSIEQLTDILENEEAIDWLEELIGPGEKYRIEYSNGFGSEAETLPDLIRMMIGSKGLQQAGVLQKITGIMVTTRIRRKKRNGKAKKKGRNR